jgi:CspA family cold shock protein
MPMTREQGSVKWFNDRKGYGFITRPSGADLFVHHAAVQMEGRRTLQNGAYVEYDVAKGARGLYAANVTVVLEQPTA